GERGAMEGVEVELAKPLPARPGMPLHRMRSGRAGRRRLLPVVICPAPPVLVRDAPPSPERRGGRRTGAEHLARVDRRGAAHAARDPAAPPTAGVEALRASS